MSSIGDGNNNDDAFNNINNTNEEEQQKRKGKGRKRIAIEKIQNETNLQVTFSKRRAGVFKKASELSTLCGAECAVVIFSPGNKPHSFGHPSVETVANRFLINASNSDVNPQGNVSDHLMMAHNEATMSQRNHELVAVDVELERAKECKKEVDETSKIVVPPLDQLTGQQYEQMKKSLESYQHAFNTRLKSKPSETSMWANQNPSTQQHQGLGFPSPVAYGYEAANIVPTVPGSSSSFGNPFHNFGYTMQYPPMGPSGSSSIYGNIGVNPTTIVPYDGTRRASGSGSGSRSVRSVTGNRNVPYDGIGRASGSGSRSRSGNINAMGTDEDPDPTSHRAPDHDTGFGGNYDSSF